MKVTIEHYENKITHEVPYEDVSIDKMIEIMEGLLKASGYCFSGSLDIVDEWKENEELNLLNF